LIPSPVGLPGNRVAHGEPMDRIAASAAIRLIGE
jgi:hypothetical protein